MKKILSKFTFFNIFPFLFVVLNKNIVIVVLLLLRVVLHAWIRRALQTQPDTQ